MKGKDWDEGTDHEAQRQERAALEDRDSNGNVIKFAPQSINENSTPEQIEAFFRNSST